MASKKPPPHPMQTPQPPRPMRAFAMGLSWLDRFREMASEPKPSDLPSLSADEVYALAYAKGLHAGQDSVCERFAGCGNLTPDEIWRRLADAIAWANEPVDRPSVRPAKE